MREFTKSLFSYSLAVSFFSLKQIHNALTPRERDEQEGPATKAFSALANAHQDQFGETLHSAFRMFDNVQRGLVGLAFSFMAPHRTDRRRNRDSHHSASSEKHHSGGSEPIRGADLQRRSEVDTVLDRISAYSYDADELR